MGNLRSERPVQACHACRRFIEAFGGLVSITDDGTTIPAFWNPVTVPDFYSAAVKALRGAVRRARVIGVFLSSEDELGTARSDAWTHFTARQPAVFKHPLLTAFQAAAAVRENRVTALTALAEFKPGVLDGALRLMQAESLYRSERFIAPVKWLRDVHNRPEGRPGDNVPWRAVGSAAAGFCDPSASVIASLLENVASCDFTFDAIKARWDAKTSPLVYQRPQAAPTAGKLAAAEAIVATFGIAPSLERRCARLAEIRGIICQPTVPPKAEPAAGGVLGHLKAKSGTPITPLVDLPAVTMTTSKFAHGPGSRSGSRRDGPTPKAFSFTATAPGRCWLQKLAVWTARVRQGRREGANRFAARIVGEIRPEFGATCSDNGRKTQLYQCFAADETRVRAKRKNVGAEWLLGGRADSPRPMLSDPPRHGGRPQSHRDLCQQVRHLLIPGVRLPPGRC